ncbi:hypothetical protein Pint_25117 [Pistacia integerrima]|uniref:Uncharacterized protein n=1 Tax=Pistacia integerrima TaxID=434235 RepID=A0ACC0YFQ6_9ROSI|nr:hypothetical protein Pint_25117 [Pistacia integerrima]
MKTDINGIIDPEGWIEWNESKLGLSTCYYAEYLNTGGWCLYYRWSEMAWLYGGVLDAGLKALKRGWRGFQLGVLVFWGCVGSWILLSLKLPSSPSFQPAASCDWSAAQSLPFSFGLVFLELSA